MKKTFEDFLREIHARIYEGLDDDMPDDFDHWLVHVQPDDFIKYAEEWAKTL